MTPAAESGNGRRLAGLIGIVAALTFLVTAIRYLGSPMRFDEVEWPMQAIGILRHGVPKLLYSEEKSIYTTPTMYLGFDAHYGMWHPPVYLYSLAAAAGLFGTGNVVLRATGLVWFLLSLFVAWKIAGLLLGRSAPLLMRAVPVALMVMTPLLMEGALFLDIDNTSLCFAILLLIWLYLKDPNTLAPRRLGLLALAFALALASKMTTPPMLIASIFVYQLLRHEPRRGFIQATAIGLGGAAIFGVAYLGYCALFRYPPAIMFQISYIGKSGMFLHSAGLTQALHSTQWNLTWISPAIAFLIAIAIVARVSAFVTTRQAEPIDLPLVFCVIGLLIYVPWGGFIGKYAFPPVAAGVLAAGIELTKRLLAFQKPALRMPNVLLAGAAAAVAVVLVAAGPPLHFRPPTADVSKAGLTQLIADPRNLYLGLNLLAFPALVFGAWRLLRGRPRLEMWAVAAIAYVLIANPIDVAKVGVMAPGSTPYRTYKEPGFEATIAFLNASRDGHLTEVILAPKDIGFYFDGQHIDIDSASDIGSGGGVAHLKEVARRPDVRYAVDSADYPKLLGFDGLMRDASLREVKRIGAFVIYENPDYNGG